MHGDFRTNTIPLGGTTSELEGKNIFDLPHEGRLNSAIRDSPRVENRIAYERPLPFVYPRFVRISFDGGRGIFFSFFWAMYL